MSPLTVSGADRLRTGELPDREVLAAYIDALEADAARYRHLRDHNLVVIECVAERRGFRSTQPGAVRETWTEHEGWTVNNLPLAGDAFDTMDAAVDASRERCALSTG